MKPSPADALPKLALQMVLDHAAALGETYQGAELGVIGSLLFICAEDAADGGRRIRCEITELRQLLEQADIQVRTDNPELSQQIREALDKAELQPLSDDTTALRAQLDSLRQVLIAYHAWVEQTFGRDAEQNRQIWALLAKYRSASRIQSLKLLTQMRAQMQQSEVGQEA